MRFIYAFRLIQNTTNDCYTLYNQHRFSLTHHATFTLSYTCISLMTIDICLSSLISFVTNLSFFHIVTVFIYFFSVPTTFVYSFWALLTSFCLIGFSWFFLFFNIHFHRFVFTYTFSSFIHAFKKAVSRDI
jgi:hypothetical protein